VNAGSTVILISALDEVADKIRGMEFGAADYVTKPQPVVVRRTGEVVRLDEGGPVIGMGFGLPFDEGSCVLAPGDRLVFYTDGLVEDLSSDGSRFGLEGLTAAFVDGRHLPLREVCGSLAAALRTRRGDTRAAEDIALLAFERY
jgi:sigma-B regulation protein RsbU (phosphoserine phosphatase)